MFEIKRLILEYFSDLKYTEKDHLYKVKGEKLKYSVSNLIKKFVRYTDFKKLAARVDDRLELPKGTTKQTWNNKGTLAIAKGNKVHFFGEVYAFNRQLKATDKYEEAIVNFWDDMPEHIIPVFTELKMYHKIKMFGGTGDVLLYNTKTRKFIIADYKTNEDIFKNYNMKTLKGPFKHLLDNPFNKYQIQFSYYQILFEQTGFEVERRILVWLRPDGSYEMYDTEDFTEILLKEIEKL